MKQVYCYTSSDKLERIYITVAILSQCHVFVHQLKCLGEGGEKRVFLMFSFGAEMNIKINSMAVTFYTNLLSQSISHAGESTHQSHASTEHVNFEHQNISHHYFK